MDRVVEILFDHDLEPFHASYLTSVPLTDVTGARPEHDRVCLQQKLGDTGGRGGIDRNELAAANKRGGCAGNPSNGSRRRRRLAWALTRAMCSVVTG